MLLVEPQPFALAMAIVSLLLGVCLRRKRERRRSKSVVPFATWNFIVAIRGMTGAEPHLFLLWMARRCGRKTFRLPLPIFRIVRFRWWGRRYFYLPLPRLRRVFAVGDAPTCRRILQDSLSNKPLEIYTSFEGITNTPVMFTSRNSAYTRSVRSAAHRAFSQRAHEVRDGDRVHRIARAHIDRWLDGRLQDLSAGDEAFDPVDEALALTFYIICEAAFGYRATYDEFRTFTDNLDLALGEFAYRQSTNPLRKVFWFLLPGVWEAKKAAMRVTAFAGQMRESYIAPDKRRGEESVTFMDRIIDNPDLPDAKQQISEIVMFMAAGHETTGSMAANAMILLAKHAEMQAGLRQSLREKENDEELHNFLLEASRIFPVAPMGSTRLTGRDFVLSDGTVIPAHSICFLPQYMIYRDADIFDDADVFVPDRWQKATQDMKNAMSLMFSLGPRNCPGQPLAIAEMNYLLPRLLDRYSLYHERESRPEYRVIMKHSGSLIKAKELATRTGPILKEDAGCFSTGPHHTALEKAKKTNIVRRIFYTVVSLMVAGTALMLRINAAKTCSPPDNINSGLKIAILTEPSPIGSYICGQSKRIEFLMQYLVESSHDMVELITVEIHDSVKPSLWRGVHVHYTHGFQLPSYNQISISFDFTGKALREIGRLRPHLIHVTTPGPLLFPSAIASRLFGIPLIMSCHTHLTAYARTYLPPGVNVVAEWLLWRYTRAVHSFADLTLVTSPQIQAEFARNHVPADVWQKGVNSTGFHPDYYNADMRYRMTGGNPGDFLLVYIGRLAEEKRLVDLKSIMQNISGARLSLVGAGPYERILRKHFEHTNTVFMGQLTGIELSQAFASGDVFVMPSRSETLGFVVLESMASGVPCVAANAGGLKHLIENNTTGFLADNEAEFVERIEGLRGSPALRDRIATAARRDVEQWTWERSMEKLRFRLYPRAMQNFHDRLEQKILRRWRTAAPSLLKSITR